MTFHKHARGIPWRVVKFNLVRMRRLTAAFCRIASQRTPLQTSLPRCLGTSITIGRNIAATRKMKLPGLKWVVKTRRGTKSWKLRDEGASFAITVSGEARSVHNATFTGAAVLCIVSDRYIPALHGKRAIDGILAQSRASPPPH